MMEIFFSEAVDNQKQKKKIELKFNSNWNFLIKLQEIVFQLSHKMHVSV